MSVIAPSRPGTPLSVNPFLRMPATVMCGLFGYLKEEEFHVARRVSRLFRSVGDFRSLGLDGELQLGMHPKNWKDLSRKASFPNVRTLTMRPSREMNIVARDADVTAVMRNITAACPKLSKANFLPCHFPRHLEAFLKGAIEANVLECLRMEIRYVANALNLTTIALLNDPAFTSLREIQLKMTKIFLEDFIKISQLKKLTVLELYPNSSRPDWGSILVLQACVDLRELVIDCLPFIRDDRGEPVPCSFLNDLGALFKKLSALRSLTIRQSMIDASVVFPALPLARGLTHLHFDYLDTKSPILQAELNELSFCKTLVALTFSLYSNTHGEVDDLIRKLPHVKKPPKLREFIISAYLGLGETWALDVRLEALRKAWGPDVTITVTSLVPDVRKDLNFLDGIRRCVQGLDFSRFAYR